MASSTLSNVFIDEELPTIVIPLTVYRLVMAAGGNRDFNSIHHNSEYAQSTGAEEMYANTSFLLATWEKLIREWMGDSGRILNIKGFRMNSFNYVGDTLLVKGKVASIENSEVDIQVWCENSRGISVGPGMVRIMLPNREEN